MMRKIVIPPYFRYSLAILFCLLILFIICSCSVSNEILLTPESEIAWHPGDKIGQTFVARQSGLRCIEVYIQPTPEAKGILTLSLRVDPDSSFDILTTTQLIEHSSSLDFHSFCFPVIKNSYGKYYYFLLDYEGAGDIQVPLGPSTMYSDGVFYKDNSPYTQQLAQSFFRLRYSYVHVLLNWIATGITWLIWGILCAGLLFFAGYIFVRDWMYRTKADFTLVFILGCSVSLVAWMALLVGGYFIGLRFSTLVVRLIVGVGCIVGFYFFIRDAEYRQHKWFWLGKEPAVTLTFWAIVLVAIALRLVIGRMVLMLPGSDAYHHNLIVKLFELQGGIPESYRPYAALGSYSYHFGFHSIVALFRWLLGKTDGLLDATKITALVLNGAIAASVGFAGERLSGNRRVSCWAAAIIGLIAVSPFCLLQWSRFSQTTGLYFLPIGLCALWERKSLMGWVSTVLLIAGIFFSHYRMFFFWGVFCLIGIGIRFFRRDYRELKNWFLLGFFSLLLILPWLLHVAWVQYDPYSLRVTHSFTVGSNDLERLGDSVINFVTNVPILVMTVISLALLVFKNESSEVWDLVSWIVILVIGSLLLIVTNTSFWVWELNTVLLSLSVPISILLGLTLERNLQLLSRTKVKTNKFILFSVFLILVSVSVSEMVKLIDLERQDMLRPTDLRAMEWIANNIESDMTMATNAIQFEWAPGWMVGIDKGYWIPLLSGRKTTVPPMVYTLEWGEGEQLRSQLEISQLIVDSGQGDKELGHALKEKGVSYLFTSPPYNPITPAQMEADPSFEKVYHKDFIWIYRIVP